MLVTLVALTKCYRYRELKNKYIVKIQITARNILLGYVNRFCLFCALFILMTSTGIMKLSNNIFWATANKGILTKRYILFVFLFIFFLCGYMYYINLAAEKSVV